MAHEDMGSDPLFTVSEIARAVKARGGRALVVGGYVRDRLLESSLAAPVVLGVGPTFRSAEAKDIDMEVFGIPADDLPDVLAPFGKVEPIGQSFPVYKIGTIDIGLPRRESKAGRGHKGFIVEGDPSMSVEAAAKRRDFTINAIAWDPLTDEHLDPFHGRDDLRRRLLKAVDPETFGDDSLRALRAVQFAARFELTLDSATAALCRAVRLDDLPPERIWGEIEKLLLRARRPSIGFALALELNVIDQLFPEMKALVNCEQEPEWHPEGDVWIHTLMVIDQARQRIDDLDRADQLIVMLGAVTHDFGKPATTALIDGRIRSLNHEEEGVAPATAFLDRLNIHSIDGKDARAQVLGLVAHHLKPGMLYKVRHELTDGAFRRLAQKANLELLARVAKSDCLGRTGTFDCSAMDWFLERARELGVDRSPPKPLLLGRHLLDLGMTPGPAMGALLKQIYEKQLDGEIKSIEEGITLASQMVQLKPDTTSE
ncbi:MAG TPA: HD domain-containing protein [Vicinamibacterales bacterium]|nr:HD domain-containing protein [Vicinamibacterales bacterium]